MIADSIYSGATSASDRACAVCDETQPPRTVNTVTINLALSGAGRAKDETTVESILQQYRSDLLVAVSQRQADRLAAVLAGNGVGSHLWRLLESLNVRHSPTCECLAWAERMNAWGPAGCRLARAEIVAHMRDSAKHYGWGELARSAAKAVTTGLVWRINLLDLYGSLLDEAIRRAEKSGPPGPGGSSPSPSPSGPGGPLPIDILLPLGPGSRNNNVELRMAIRSIEQHARRLRRIVVVGAIPDWLRETDRVFPVRRDEFRANKASRISLKVRWAFEHLDLTDTVAFWNDDYLLNRNADLRTIKDTYHGNLRHPHASTPWQRLLEHTGATLAAGGLPTRHYDIHVPILLRRDLFLSLADWWERSRRERPGLVMKSIYGNHHCHATGVVSPDKKLGATWRDRIDSVSRLWLFSYGDDALKTGLAGWLQQRFPTPSAAETTPHLVRGAPPQTIVCVLGPFRSGTTAVAGLLHRLGVSMGDGWPVRRANKGGTYEDHELARLCRSWFRERAMTERSRPAKRRAGLRRWLSTRPAITGAKHPTLCLCVPQILRAWPGVRFVACDRPAAESITSLQKLGWSPDNATSAVTRMIATRDRDLARCGRPVCRIAYHDLLRDPAAAVSALIDFAGIHPTEDQRRAAETWIDPTQQTVRAA
jgi:hypothetical protein